jgi:hypothetical protein
LVREEFIPWRRQGKVAKLHLADEEFIPTEGREGRFEPEEFIPWRRPNPARRREGRQVFEPNPV